MTKKKQLIEKNKFQKQSFIMLFFLLKGNRNFYKR